MKKEVYIKEHLKEVPSDISPMETIFVSKDSEVYVGLKGLCDKEESLIDLLAEHEIIKLDTQNEWRERKKYPVACIGFSEKEQKWYGWSHRAFYGFTIGSKVKFGDCAYRSVDKEDYERTMMNFWSDPEYKDMKIVRGDDPTKFKIEWVYSNNIPNVRIRNTVGGVECFYPKVYGRGEWEAKTLEDAKQMAKDFAEGVS